MTNIKNKVDHVLKAKQTRRHGCHWPGCDAQVPPVMWGCREHWYALPASLRRKIWATYEPGQEISGTPSASYIKVANEVQEWIAKHA